MISVSGKDWEEEYTIKRLVEKIKIDHSLNDIQAKIILSRNYSKEEIYLIKNKIDLKNPFHNTKDFLLACELLKKNLKNQNKILIIGDYDVDGCMSTCLLVNFLKEKNADIDYFIPDRFKDGYGASKDLVIKLIKQFDPKLIIFLDCGSSSYDATEYINTKKIQTLIIDHHNTKYPYPVVNVFINPKKNSEYKNYDYLCTTFLTYLFIDLYIKLTNDVFSIQNNLILVLLATVSDVMPIRGINKILSKKVLSEFDIDKNFVLKNISKKLNIKKKLELYELGYKIGPVVNAAGRLANANQIIELFTTKSSNQVSEIVENICKLNDKRKLIENKILNELELEKFNNEKGIIFIYKSNLHEGLIGIIAARIKEYFNKPCFILTNSNNILKGSARSTADFNIGELIQKLCLLGITINGGGHNLAAGVSLKKSKFNEFKNYINKIYNAKVIKVKNYYTSIISLKSINKEFAKSINLLGPFGNKNPTPIFLIQDVKFIQIKFIKNLYISCFIKKDSKIVKSISFNHLNSKISYEILNSNNNFDVLVKIKSNTWNNKSSIELEIIDLIKKVN
ncbi:DHHA1 domain-containing protein [Candidatus Pelagibacter sp.]|nr:DHHA1 domain-containing protein [Candidatus Pelagibacter sp.]